MTGKVERRKHPRIKDKNISVKLSGEGFHTITQSLDVSASGIYCKVDRKIPLMTQIQLVLSIPSKGKSSTTLNVDGVVVREHPVMVDGRVDYYDIAIFFNMLSQKEKQILVTYIENKAE